jgi:hypothetical protein
MDGIREAWVEVKRNPEPSNSLDEAQARFEKESRLLLVEPARAFLKQQPIQRSLEAFQTYTAAAGPAPHGRAKLDAQLQRVMVLASLDLTEPWLLSRAPGEPEEWTRWQERHDSLAKSATALLASYAHWAQNAGEATARSARAESADKKRPANKNDKSEARYALWVRRNQAVASILEAELAFRDLSMTSFSSAREFVQDVRRERECVLESAARTRDWIVAGAEANDAPPHAAPDLVSPEERLRPWIQNMEAEATRLLPEEAEFITPGIYPRWNSAAPRAAFAAAFKSRAGEPMRQAAEEYWGQNAAIAREIARAREVVDYWREASPEQAATDDEALFADARHNAASVLSTQLQVPLAVEELETKFRQIHETWSDEGATTFLAALYGWTALLESPRGRTFLRSLAARTGKQRLHTAAHNGGQWVSGRLDRVLESFGGKVPSRPRQQAVVRRTTLRDTMALPASKVSNLPALYRLLFRVAPVEDKRFLVGRKVELSGLAQAVRDWDEGRFAACLIVGSRGSGKTSLLNCAGDEVFVGHTVVRGQFRERALTADAIDAFLRQLLGITLETPLEDTLRKERRIIAIEESERTFLRRVGGFEGAHHLVHLIHRTAGTTLWIIGMNDKALRVLDAGTQFGRAFSHRINATAVSREDMEKAVLERHRLSGLGLEFAPPPPEDPRLSRVKGLVGLQSSAESLFFDSLFQQSEGILRSAFELWLSSIERVEGETLKLRQPLAPAFGKFRNELGQEDQFALLAIQEHGSLTQSELAEVLCETWDASRSRLDRLAALGLIERDPEHPGLRVRPEAQRFTSDLFRRANLT